MSDRNRERLSEAEFNELKRKRDASIEASIQSICDEHGEFIPSRHVRL